MVNQRVAKSERDVYDELERVDKLGAEGLMLRKAGSLYEMGRSRTLLKVCETIVFFKSLSNNLTFFVNFFL